MKTTSKTLAPVQTEEVLQPILKTVKDFYIAISLGNVPKVVDLLDPNVAWTEAEGFPYYSGTWRSPQEVVDKLLVPLGRDWDNFAVTPHDFIESGNRVVAFGIYTGVAKETGKKLTAPFAHLWRVHKGRIASFYMYTDTLLVMRAMV